MNYKKISNIIKKAGKIALKYFMNPQTQYPRYKEDKTIVTEADIVTQDYITSKLTKLTPAYKIVGEETAFQITKEDIDKLKKTRYIWAIDPIDGTASFSNNLPTWVISLGLLEYGKPIAGWVYAPVWNQLFYTFPEDKHSYLNGEILPQTNFKNGLKISTDTCIIIDSKTFRKYHLEGFVGKVRSFGSTAFHITFVATGTVIAANSIRNKLWDIAASAAICKKCNINLKYISGKEIDYCSLLNMKHTSEDVITCSDSIFEIIKSYFKPIE